MINAYVYHWYTGQSHWERIPDLQAWIVKHNGAVVVRPPEVAQFAGSMGGFWSLWITDETNRFSQR